MADNQANIELTANDQGVLAALAKVERAFDKVGDKLNRIEKEAAKGNRATNNMLQGAVKGATAFASALGIVTTGVGAIQSAAAALKREYQNLLDRQRDAASENVSFEGALSQAVRNATGIFTAEEVKKRAIQMAQATGVTPARAASTIGSAITSTGVTNEAEANLAIQAAQDALRFAPELDPQGVEAISGISASLAKRFNVAPSAAIGFVQRVGGQANIRELAPLVENLAPVIANLTQFGFSPTESGALASTITQGTGDVTGELSGTAAVNLADSLSKLVEAAPGRFGGLGVNEAGSIVDQAGRAAAGQALQILTDDPELKKIFFEGGAIDGTTIAAANLGKGKAKPTLRGILTAGSVENRQFIGSQAAIGGFAEGQQTYDDLLREIASVTPVSQLQRAFTGGVSQIRVADKQGALTAVSRQGLEDTLKAAGFGDASQQIARFAFETNAGLTEQQPIETVVEQLQSRARGLRRTRQTSIGDPAGQQVPVTIAPSASELKQAGQLDVIAETLKTMLDDQRRRDPPQGNRQPAAAALGRRN